jgi:uncharacterized iron-regulated membrane protein
MITLTQSFVAQQAFSSAQVEVLKNEDDPKNGKLRTLVELGGNASFHFWIDVYTGPETYNSNWTDTDVANAVKAWFAAQGS